MKNFFRFALASGIVLSSAFSAPSSASAEAGIKVDPLLSPYVKGSEVKGNLSSVGSDTLNNLMTLWAEKFSELQKDVKIQVEGKGSGTAPPALIAGTAQLAPMSREMKPSEEDEFQKKFGYKPTAIKVAVDALGIFVHKDNPLESLSIEQVDAVFSKTRKQGLATDISKWGDLGLSAEWALKPISMYGRNSASGTYGYFKDHVLKNGDFKDTVKEQPGSASVVQGITVDKYGIGYSGMGYKTAGVKALKLQSEPQGEAFEGTLANSLSGDYPLARFLMVYINQAPDKATDALTAEFLKLVLSREGQEVVVKDGYYPLPAEIVKEELAKIHASGPK